MVITNAGIYFIFIFVPFIGVALSKIEDNREVIDRYQKMTEFSDEGGMAVIYKAYNTVSERWCIIKVLRQKFIHDRETIEKLYQEAEIIRDIKEKAPKANIPEIYSKGTIKDKFVELPYIEMEYIQGNTSLADYIEENGKLTLEQSDTIIKKLLPAIKAGHQKGYIHRDIKPENVLLRNKNLDEPVLIDYGIAKLEGEKSEETGIYMAPEYIAPEQGEKDQDNLTIKVDNYLLGILWYKLLTGRVPFKDNNPLQVIEKHQEEPIAPLIEENIPSERKDIILELMQKKPQARPNIGEVANYFDIVIDLKEEKEQTEKSDQKNKFGKYVFIALFIGVIIGAGIYGSKKINLTNNEKEIILSSNSLYNINPDNYQDRNYLSQKHLSKIYQKIIDQNKVKEICKYISKKKVPDDPTQIFYIVDPKNVKKRETFYLVSEVILVNIDKNKVSYKNNHKIHTFLKKAIFAFDENLLEG